MFGGATAAPISEGVFRAILLPQSAAARYGSPLPACTYLFCKLVSLFAENAIDRCTADAEFARDGRRALAGGVELANGGFVNRRLAAAI